MNRSPRTARPRRPRSSADLDDHSLGVVRVALDHRQADLLLQLGDSRRRVGDDLLQLGVVAVLGQQLPRPLQVVAQRAPLARQLTRLLELAVLAPDLGVALPIGDHLGIRHLPLQLREAVLDLLDQLLDHPPSVTSPGSNGAPRGRTRTEWALIPVMAGISDRSRRARAIAGRQDDVVERSQLLGLGYTRHAIDHRLATGRLYQLWPGVYAVGRRQVTRRGLWRAAVLACGRDATLSHASTAELRGIPADEGGVIHISVPSHVRRRLAGIQAHRRSNLRSSEIADCEGIPTTRASTTLVDLAPRLSQAELERAINDADKLDLIDPETLRREIERMPPRPGKARLRELLDGLTFVITDSELERRFVPIGLRAGLGRPVTGAYLNGFKVDFFWPDLGLVVETDGLRYHRTAAQQARDRLRDQKHTAAGLMPLRFTHAQVRYEANHVEATLRAVRNRLRR